MKQLLYLFFSLPLFFSCEKYLTEDDLSKLRDTIVIVNKDSVFVFNNDTICIINYDTIYVFNNDNSKYIDKNQFGDYEWIKIGKYTWMAENLKSLTIQDRERINLGDGVFVNKHLLGDQAFNIKFNKETLEYYGNELDYYNEEIVRDFGYHYNYMIAKEACPDGSHLPALYEWQDLIDNLGGQTIAGGKLKIPGFEYFIKPNYGATNETYFNAKGAGVVLSDIYDEYRDCQFWTDTWEIDSKTGQYYSPYVIMLNYSSSYADKGSSTTTDYKYRGLSVRCVKDTI